MVGGNCSLPGCGTSRRKTYAGQSIFRVTQRQSSDFVAWREATINVVKKYRVIDADLKRQIQNGNIFTCEKHYKKEDIEYTKTGKKTLRFGAVPTLQLPNKSYLPSVTSERRTLDRKRSTRSFKMSSIPVKLLNASQYGIQHNWSRNEDRALIEFIGCAQMDEIYGWDNAVNEWPIFVSRNKLWGDAAKHIKESTKSTFLLTNKSVRARIHKHLKKKYEHLDAAEDALGLNESDYVDSLVSRKQQKEDKKKEAEAIPSLKIRAVDKGIQTYVNCKNVSASVDLPPTLNDLKRIVVQLNNDDKLAITEFLFSILCSQPGNDHGLIPFIPGFVKLSLEAMLTLRKFKKPNILHKFAYCLATKRPSSDEPLFIPTRMPFGLVQYQIEFYSCDYFREIKVPDDYQQWYEFMVSEFNKAKFVRLFRGPMWLGTEKEDLGNPLKAQVNVAAPCPRTVQRHKKLQKDEEAFKEKNQPNEVSTTTEKELTYHIFLPPKKNRGKKKNNPEAPKEINAEKRKKTVDAEKATETKKQRCEESFSVGDGICMACGGSYSQSDCNESLLVCGVRDEEGHLIDGCGGCFHLACTDLADCNLTIKELQVLTWHCQACAAVACILNEINV